MYNVMSVFTAAEWDLGNFLKNAGETLKRWGGLVLIILGAVMLIVAAYQIAKGLMTHGRQGQPTNWLVVIILLIVGGAFIAAGGWGWFQGIAAGGQKTINDLGGNSSILPFLLL